MKIYKKKIHIINMCTYIKIVSLLWEDYKILYKKTTNGVLFIPMYLIKNKGS